MQEKVCTTKTPPRFLGRRGVFSGFQILLQFQDRTFWVEMDRAQVGDDKLFCLGMRRKMVLNQPVCLCERPVGLLPAEKAIPRLEGIQCLDRGTSCPDQLAKALKQCTAQRPE